MRKRVLVTRPEPGASATAARLEALGFEPIVLPLTRIVPVEPKVPAPPEAYDAVIVTSPNAVRHIPAKLIDAFHTRPLYAVGEATGSEARKSGFTNVRIAGGTAVQLADLISKELPAGSHLLHLAAVQRTKAFADALDACGIRLDVAEVYSAEEVSYPTDFVLNAITQGEVWGAPVLSERGGQLIAALTAREGMRQAFGKTAFFCISQKVAAAISGVDAERIFVSAAPSEESVLELLLTHSGG